MPQNLFKCLKKKIKGKKELSAAAEVFPLCLTRCPSVLLHGQQVWAVGGADGPVSVKIPNYNRRWGFGRGGFGVHPLFFVTSRTFPLTPTLEWEAKQPVRLLVLHTLTISAFSLSLSWLYICISSCFHMHPWLWWFFFKCVNLAEIQLMGSKSMKNKTWCSFWQKEHQTWIALSIQDCFVFFKFWN